MPVGANRIEGRYRYIKADEGWKAEHRWVMEIVLGRKLSPNEIVHHKDGDPLNNSPENLVVCISLRDHLDNFHKDDLVNPPTHHNGRKKIKLGPQKRG